MVSMIKEDKMQKKRHQIDLMAFLFTRNFAILHLGLLCGYPYPGC